jgi:hypothetical protein
MESALFSPAPGALDRAPLTVGLTSHSAGRRPVAAFAGSLENRGGRKVSRLSGRAHDAPPGMPRRERGARTLANSLPGSRRTTMNIAITRGAADRGHRIVGMQEFAD